MPRSSELARQAVLHDAHPVWGDVPTDDTWSRSENWRGFGDSTIPVELDWMVRTDALAVGAPREAGPALACGCHPIRVHVNIQPDSEDAGTWHLPEQLVCAVGRALGVENLDAYVSGPWPYPDFEAPALAILNIVPTRSRCSLGIAEGTTLTYEDACFVATARVARLLFTVYPLGGTDGGDSE